MTADAFARLLKARRVGKGKWIARCVAHDDRKPSLSIAEGKWGVLIKCMSHGCDTRDILDALGLTFNDIFYDRMSPQVRARTSIYDRQEDLERQAGLILWLKVLESGTPINGRLSASCKKFDAILSRWKPIESTEAKNGR